MHGPSHALFNCARQFVWLPCLEIVFVFSTSAAPVTVSHLAGGAVRVDNGIVALEVIPSAGQQLQQRFYASELSTPLLTGFVAPVAGTSGVAPLYDQANKFVDKRILVNGQLDMFDIAQNSSEVVTLVLWSSSPSRSLTAINKTLTLRRDEHFFRADVSANLASAPELEYLLSTYQFEAECDSPPTPQYKALGDADWNDEAHVLAVGTQTILAHLKQCEELCASTIGCTTGIYINGTVRHGECWLASQRRVTPRYDFCGAAPGQECFAFSQTTLSPSGCPRFVAAPHIKRVAGTAFHLPGLDYVMGDRTFNSPAVALEAGTSSASPGIALAADTSVLNAAAVHARGARPIDGKQNTRWGVPQLDAANPTMPVSFDVELDPLGNGSRAVVSFGLMDYVVEQHVYFRHINDGSMIRQIASRSIRINYDILLKAAAETRMYQNVARHLWARYGREEAALPLPLVMPLREYASVSFPAAVNFSSAFVEFNIDGIPVGGQRTMGPGAVIHSRMHFLQWWNQVHMAYGFNHWGSTVADLATMRRRADLMVNLTTKLPKAQGDGLWQSVCTYDETTRGCKWTGALRKIKQPYNPSIVPTFWDVNSDWISTSSCARTAGYMFQLAADEPTFASRLHDIALKHADWLALHLRPDGGLAEWFESAALQPQPWLGWNAHSGAYIWALAEAYKVSHSQHHFTAALAAATFLTREILPEHRWADVEAFYSCATKPEASFDNRSHQWPRNTLSMIWAVDGLVSLYEITVDSKWLLAAEEVADMLSLFQAVWNPSILGDAQTAYVFGGFRSQNSDAEWLDMRQSTAGVALLRLGNASGRQDYLERGAAGLRAGLSLLTHPRVQKNGVYPMPNLPRTSGRPDVPLGLEPENADHEGIPQLPARSGPDWGEIGALSALGWAQRHFCDLWIDTSRNLTLAINAAVVHDWLLSGSVVQIHVESLIGPSSLPTMPWTQSWSARLCVIGLSTKSTWSLMVNGKSVAQYRSASVLAEGVAIPVDGVGKVLLWV